MLRFGVHSGQQYSTFADCLELWQRAEELGLDWVSVFDHYRPPLGGPDGPCFDGPSLLAALAARTSRVRCAILVSAVTWRHPATAAAIAATIDHVSSGRLEFGLGAAGPDLAYEQYGLPFPGAGVRLDMLEEACQVMRGLWGGGPFTFHGEHYRLTDARLSPRPVQERLPLVIGGGGERRTLRVAARHADVWNTLAGDLAGYRRKVGLLAGYCAEEGRPPADIRQSLTFRAVLAATPADVERRRAERLALLPAGSPDLAEYLTFGTPEQCVEDLLGYAALGVRDFLLGCRPPLDWETIELFASRVVPAVRARVEN
ncbi:LLM class flavin-dependent oxidoreductase [Nonomuraea jiangxiensis]|uniref:Flavin-dependent oxidoreductase, luciferase family (Includes alkanesulfonate monooxygenase SsuD and methylene tetrahydromethanopterin reductase) n=1 Tax=Nonomuraea jiangxiensis TaxID=633440 RepID=A0A1G8EM20_9ACTN|nr:LLM class flavin-dependent oxidoreductase [Nonomuraea jiangxiensis]SDH70945.1 Flavin-dependent oxidoreductase, luciferase family (includes alkanesulfonate monooxygenase SsuD and methylene tetrahydromethanopterin reductase) [Nonomuraea jiangxiensis]